MTTTVPPMGEVSDDEECEAIVEIDGNRHGFTGTDHAPETPDEARNEGPAG